MDISGAKIYYTIPILGGIPITETLVNTWVIMLIITLLCIWLTRGLKVHATSKKQIAVEYLVNMISGLVNDNMGQKFSYFIPFIAALFCLSAFSSLSSLVGAYAPTSDLSTLLGWSLLVFAMITFMKFKTNGFGGYFKGYLEPIPILLPFNIISEVATPVSMAFRHFGNIASGGVIMALLYGALAALSNIVLGLIPGVVGETLAVVPIFQVGIPAILSVYFDVFSSFLQAFIFCMLTMMYIATAAEE